MTQHIKKIKEEEEEEEEEEEGVNICVSIRWVHV